ncbi:MAG: Gfo/Idh/MocA family protein [Acidobacteriota bacterium]
MKSKKTRRDFLRTVAAGSTAASIGLRAHSAHARQIISANDRVVVAVMGANNRGSALARGFARLPDVDVAYICDVDEAAVAKGVGAVVNLGLPAPRSERDFRRALEDPDVDALVIAAPDHWHAPATILACQAGKHVYVEKPCSHNPAEGELMVEAARKYQRLVQIGTQRRSSPLMIEAVEQLRGGIIGRVYHSRSGYVNRRPSIGHGRPAAIPQALDYDLWQGPAPRRSFQDNLIHYNWHWFWHWGSGEAGNMAIHTVDLSRWGLGVDYPIQVSSSGGRYHWTDDQETPDTQVIGLDFEGGRSVMWEGLSCTGRGAKLPGVVSFHGEGGSLVFSDGSYQVYDLDGKLIFESEHPEKGPGDAYHFTNFVEAIQGRAVLNAEIEEGHKSTLLCHLANIALRLQRTLACDPANGHIREESRPATEGPTLCHATFMGQRLGRLFPCDPVEEPVPDNDEVMKLWGREYEPGWEPWV